MDAVGFGLLTRRSRPGRDRRHHVLRRPGAALRLRQHHAGRPRHRDVYHLVLALTTSPAIAFATLVVFGPTRSVWGTTATVVRQRGSDELLGRVAGSTGVALIGGIVIGTPIGGLLARTSARRAVLVRLRRLGAPGRLLWRRLPTSPTTRLRRRRPDRRDLIPLAAEARRRRRAGARGAQGAGGREGGGREAQAPRRTT